MGIYLNDAELKAFQSLDPLLVKAYVWLRTKMDRRTRIAGRVTTISLASIAEAMDYEIRKGSGAQWIRLGETPKQRKDAADRIVERLGKGGLISKLGGAFLVFLFPLADGAEVRPNQTGVERATGLSTDRATHEHDGNPHKHWDCGDSMAERATPENDPKGPNGRHIKGQGFTPPQSSSTPGWGVAPGDAGAGGVSRDRAAPSQAGSLGRPGKPHGDPDRDRPAGSHVGPWGADSNASHRDRPPASHPALPHRLEAGPDAGDAYPDGQWPTNARSSAEKDSFADGMAAAAAPDAQLRAVLCARGIREDLMGVVDDWAGHGVTPDELAAAIDKARAARIAAGSTQPIPLKYVARVLASNRAAARRAVERLEGRAPRAARGGFGDLEALALQLGIARSRPGESPEQFRNRVQAARQQVRGDGQA